jgi:adenine-specific DNA-methyltransferase
MGKKIEDYDHKNHERLNNPDVGLVNADNDSQTKSFKYKFDPHLDPELQFDVTRAEVEKLIQSALEASKRQKSSLASSKKCKTHILTGQAKQSTRALKCPQSPSMFTRR